MGRDIFEFVLSDEGKLYPYGGKDDTLYRSPTNTIESNGHYWKNNNYPNTHAAQIIESGWKMDY